MAASSGLILSQIWRILAELCEVMPGSILKEIYNYWDLYLKK